MEVLSSDDSSEEVHWGTRWRWWWWRGYWCRSFQHVCGQQTGGCKDERPIRLERLLGKLSGVIWTRTRSWLPQLVENPIRVKDCLLSRQLLEQLHGNVRLLHDILVNFSDDNANTPKLSIHVFPRGEVPVEPVEERRWKNKWDAICQIMLERTGSSLGMKILADFFSSLIIKLVLNLN
jgi:hypothetical protein